MSDVEQDVKTPTETLDHGLAGVARMFTYQADRGGRVELDNMDVASVTTIGDHKTLSLYDQSEKHGALVSLHPDVAAQVARWLLEPMPGVTPLRQRFVEAVRPDLAESLERAYERDEPGGTTDSTAEWLLDVMEVLTAHPDWDAGKVRAEAQARWDAGTPKENVRE